MRVNYGEGKRFGFHFSFLDTYSILTTPVPHA